MQITGFWDYNWALVIGHMKKIVKLGLARLIFIWTKWRNEKKFRARKTLWQRFVAKRGLFNISGIGRRVAKAGNLTLRKRRFAKA